MSTMSLKAGLRALGIQLVLCFCLLVVDVDATPGLLGKGCLGNNRCMSGNHVCDTNAAPEHRCKIRKGFKCTRDPQECVTGATCESGKCACNKNAEAVGSLCNPSPRKVGGDCNPQASQACDDPRAQCTSSGSGKNTCQCLGSVIEDFQNYICAIPGKKVGGACDRSEEQPCDDVNAECVGSPATCQCKTDFVTNPWELSCELDVDKDCTDREDKCKQGSTCDPSNNRCRIAERKSCQNETDQCVSGAVCITEDSISVCTCILGVYVANATTGICSPAAKKVGGFCDVDDVNPCDDVSATCSESSLTCKCQEGVPVNITTLTCGAALHEQRSLLILFSSVPWLIHKLSG